jgi:pyridoxine 5-phosphate synthase
MTNLSVNLNKVALLRNARNFGRPSVIEAAFTCIKAGAQGITVHPRPDQRHINKMKKSLYIALVELDVLDMC